MSHPWRARAEALALVLGLALATLLPAAPVRADHQPRNEIADHPSPYLAMHGEDPVHWRSWGEAAVSEARRTARPMFVSVGYFSCHWCHVMHRESYSDAQVAGVLNRHFVPVKVDREIDPALDDHLIRFVQATRGHAGWPLNVVVTPDGYPLVGATYLPRESLLTLLDRLIEQWTERRSELSELARAAAATIYEDTAPGPARSIGAARAEQIHNRFIEQAMRVADDTAGGFGDSTKFPSVPQLDALLATHRRFPDPALREFLLLTFEQMASQGLRDHLGGGFFRYATDPDWQIPHFEKMLYDNALLAKLYLDAARILGEPSLAAVGRDTLDFMLRDLWSSSGAFIASLSAVDDENVEGGYYLFHRDDLAALLDAREARVATEVWGFDGPPSLEHGHLPVQAKALDEVAASAGIGPREATAALESARRKLVAVRAERSLPRDDKLLAGWNGLALAALARAAGLEGAERYRAIGARVRDYLVGTLWDGTNLSRARSSDGRIYGSASLQDYAFVAAGLLAWSEHTGLAADREVAGQVIEAAWRRFHGEAGWRLRAETLIPYGGARTAIADGPMPSPSAVLLATTLRHARAAARPDLEQRARTALLTDGAPLIESGYFHATRIRLITEHFVPAPATR